MRSLRILRNSRPRAEISQKASGAAGVAMRMTLFVKSDWAMPMAWSKPETLKMTLMAKVPIPVVAF